MNPERILAGRSGFRRVKNRLSLGSCFGARPFALAKYEALLEHMSTCERRDYLTGVAA